MSFTVLHELRCECGADLTSSDSVKVHFSVAGHEFDKLSSVDGYGQLYDILDANQADRGLIHSGYHSGSYCVACGEQIEELDGGETSERWYVRDPDGGKIWAGEALRALKEARKPVLPEEVEKVVNHLKAWKGNDVNQAHGRVCGQAAEMLANLSAKKEVLSVAEMMVNLSNEDAALISELYGIRTAKEIIRIGEDDSIGLVLKQAIERISSFSAKGDVLALAKRIELTLRTTRILPVDFDAALEADATAIIDRANSLKRTHDFTAAWSIARTEYVERMISSFSREICITGSIEGGVLSIDALPEGVTVDIRDYDVEGCTEDEVDQMSKDDEGRPHFLAG